MYKVTFITFDGNVNEVVIENGGTVMEAATHNLVPGIDADCGGFCACATCHVHVDKAWLARLPRMSEDEDSMLALVEDRNETSRLGCQIEITPELDGLVVYTPEHQH